MLYTNLLGKYQTFYGITRYEILIKASKRRAEATWYYSGGFIMFDVCDTFVSTAEPTIGLSSAETLFLLNVTCI